MKGVWEGSTWQLYEDSSIKKSRPQNRISELKRTADE